MAKSEKIERVRMKTPVFRVSFPNLFEARAIEGDPNSKPKFGVSALWTPAKFTAKEKELWKKIMGELDKEAKRKFGKPWKELPSNVKRGLRNGDEKDGMDGYGEGTRFANLTTKTRPGVVDKDRNEISPEEGNADEIYPGCYARATVVVYSYDNKGKGVAIGLNNIQKVKDGPRLDNRVAAEDDFEDEIESDWLDQDGEDGEGDGDGDDDFN